MLLRFTPITFRLGLLQLLSNLRMKELMNSVYRSVLAFLFSFFLSFILQYSSYSVKFIESKFLISYLILFVNLTGSGTCVPPILSSSSSHFFSRVFSCSNCCFNFPIPECICLPVFHMLCQYSHILNKLTLLFPVTYMSLLWVGHCVFHGPLCRLLYTVLNLS